MPASDKINALLKQDKSHMLGSIELIGHNARPRILLLTASNYNALQAGKKHLSRRHGRFRPRFTSGQKPFF